MDNAAFLETLETRVRERRRKLMAQMRVRVEQTYHRMQQTGTSADTNATSRSIIRLYGTVMRELGSTWVRSVDELLMEEGLDRLPGSTVDLRRKIADGLCRDAAQLELHMRKTLEELPHAVAGDADNLQLRGALDEVERDVDRHLDRESKMFDFKSFRTKAQAAEERRRREAEERGEEVAPSAAEPSATQVEEDENDPFITVKASPRSEKSVPRSAAERRPDVVFEEPAEESSWLGRILDRLLPSRS